MLVDFAHAPSETLIIRPPEFFNHLIYKNCPLPTPEDRLFFILVYLKTYALQVVQVDLLT